MNAPQAPSPQLSRRQRSEKENATVIDSGIGVELQCTPLIAVGGTAGAWVGGLELAACTLPFREIAMPLLATGVAFFVGIVSPDSPSQSGKTVLLLARRFSVLRAHKP